MISSSLYRELPIPLRLNASRDGDLVHIDEGLGKSSAQCQELLSVIRCVTAKREEVPDDILTADGCEVFIPNSHRSRQFTGIERSETWKAGLVDAQNVSTVQRAHGANTQHLKLNRD
jgi:hypothetical protein